MTQSLYILVSTFCVGWALRNDKFVKPLLIAVVFALLAIATK